MKKLNKIGMMMVAGSLLATASCSDFADYNSVGAASEPSADKTLWENIQANANLSDFAQVLKHVGFDEVLNESHTYTVWAPVNGSFDKDSLFQLPKNTITKEFVQNMVANYSHKETDINDTTVYMLNEKLLKFAGKNTSNLTFDGKQIRTNGSLGTFNCPSANGILYTINNPSVFRYNGYEVIEDEKAVASKFRDMVMKYHTEFLDEQNSVKGEIIDGLQHYDDSVKVIFNTFTSGMLNAQLENEDSLYTILIPNDAAWDDAYSRMKPYFKYIPSVNYQDLAYLKTTDSGEEKGGSTSSSKVTFMDANLGKATAKITAAPADSELDDAAYWNDSIVRRHITNNLIYSETNKKYNSKFTTLEKFEDGDSIYSTTRNKMTGLEELDNATVSTRTLSNGHARIISNLPFSSWDTYAPKIKTRNLQRYVTAPGYKTTNFRVHNLPSSVCVLDDPSEKDLVYVRADVPEGHAFAPELDFGLPNVLSTTYDIYAVVVPGWIEASKPDFVRKPYTLRFDISYTNEKNEIVVGRFDGERVVELASEAKSIPAFEVGKEKIDTVKLGRVTFPICYAGTGAYPNIKVFCTLSSFGKSNREKYEQQIRIANIIMKPLDLVEYEEKLKAIKKED